MSDERMLVVNAGSSSLKIDVYRFEPHLESVLSVSVENIGTDRAELLPSKAQGGEQSHPITAPTLRDAVQVCSDWLSSQEIPPITTVAYRVVHGGARFRAPAVIDEEVVKYLTSITELAPNHMPHTIACIDAFRTQYTTATHIACFDTAFFANIPAASRHLALPKRYRESGVIRYGFHGLSYGYLLDSFRRHEGEVAANGRIIMLHLGSGASVAACHNGKPVDMSMGFTPGSGIIMGTRSGDLDPGAILYIMKRDGLTPDAMADIIMRQSGLAGLSDSTADMRQLIEQQATNEAAALAVEMFCRSVRKTIGAYATEVGGIDSIIFTGGIGERSAHIRERVLSGLGFLGVSIDQRRNTLNERLISADDSAVGVHVIGAREDYEIAKQAFAIKQADTQEKGGA